MFGDGVVVLCDGCLRDSCADAQKAGFFDRCQACGRMEGSWESPGDEPGMDGKLTLDQVRLRLLQHARDLARQLQGETLTAASVLAKLECAREMCRLAGIPETIIEGTIDIA